MGTRPNANACPLGVPRKRGRGLGREGGALDGRNAETFRENAMANGSVEKIGACRSHLPNADIDSNWYGAHQVTSIRHRGRRATRRSSTVGAC